MNILLINYEFPPLGAGASTATWHIGKELAAMGHRVLVVTSGYKKNTGYGLENGMTIYRCPAIRKKVSQSNLLEMASFVASAFICLPRLARKHRIEGAIVFFSFPCGPLGLWINMLFNIPYIVSLRGGDVPGNEKRLDRIHKILTPLRQLIYRRSLAVVANSQGSKNLAEKADSYPVRVIPNGIDTKFFTPVDKKLDNNYFRFMFAGRLSDQKNLYFMLNQLASFKQSGFQRLKIHMAGDGPLKKELQDFADKSGLSENIEWYGWVSKNKLLELYRHSDCFINPSFCEGMPNAVLEAMACGLTVIASNVPGNQEVVDDGKNGFLFEIDASDKFQEAVKKAVTSFSTVVSMGKNSRRKVEEHFSWQKTAHEYLIFFIKGC
ncbi:glycosyltransferase family 4 protein [uncultured Desulfobacter sp.]|uniref:glycosyltransferase family 4 protein n=1 Tax=uncultured Desulfobacter sp. TaxID=240139 RepID=UPI002AAAB14C|nr:glycosyltransferase family 4 protein [uncultured Desulfobacter sp.]